MKIFLSILVIQFAFNGLSHADPDEAVLENSDIEQVQPALQSDPFLQAEYLFHSGEVLEAKTFYHDYLSRNPSGKRSYQALFRLGLIDQSSRSFSSAIRFYQILLERFSKSILTNSARFNMAVCHYELADYDHAEALFQKVLRSSPIKKSKWEAMVYLARIDEGRMNYEKALSKLKKVYGQVEDKEIRQHAVTVTKNLINEKIGVTQASALIQKFGNGFPVDHLLLKEISFFREAGHISNYVASVEKFIEAFPNHPRKAEVGGWLDAIKESAETKVKIGVVLPLTGKLALTGQRVLQGIQLAVNKLPSQSREKFSLEVRDSGNQSRLKALISELASLPSVVGIIGPLLSDEVKIAGEIARQYYLPVLSPTASTQGLVDDNPYVFRNALTREIQAKFLAEYSVNNLHLRRFAVLHPLEPFGLELKDIFIKEVEALGGEIVAVSGYERSQNDFKKQILEIGGVEDDNLVKIARELLLNDGEVEDFSDTSVLSRPVIDMGHLSERDVEKLKVSLELSYDAIFIPGVYDKVGLIIPQLAFYNVNKVSLLGANGWNSPELVKLGGKYLKSVYFVDGFYPESHQLEVQRFVQEFKTNFGEEPLYLSAQAFDAANIFIKNILAGAENRVKMWGKLKRVKDFPGVTGKTTLLPSGDSEKNIFALTVKRKKIVQEN
ncbi:MAG: ABC transporter substrate-binding protein [Nitrospina sp.]|jgi:branched-chain amino acid transport system substrate-binding protein|nr:ABC transporter substrate-binding protein [Nitrospina sp.]MBT5632013.1 ABC transporter substrate-binding protein [Nitrospina sp.]